MKYIFGSLFIITCLVAMFWPFAVWINEDHKQINLRATPELREFETPKIKSRYKMKLEALESEWTRVMIERGDYL